MVGFSTPDLKLEGNNYSQGKGYYLYLNNWSLYGVGKSGMFEYIYKLSVIETY